MLVSLTNAVNHPSEAHKTISRRRELAFARQRRQLSPRLHSLQFLQARTSPLATLMNSDNPKDVRYPGAAWSPPIRSSTCRNTSRGTATSANWNTSRRAWRTSRPPILMSLTCTLRSDQRLGRHSLRTKFLSAVSGHIFGKACTRPDVGAGFKPALPAAYRIADAITKRAGYKPAPTVRRRPYDGVELGRPFAKHLV